MYKNYVYENEISFQVSKYCLKVLKMQNLC